MIKTMLATVMALFAAAAFAALDLLPLADLPKTALRKLAEATVSRAA